MVRTEIIGTIERITETGNIYCLLNRRLLFNLHFVLNAV